MFYWFLKWIAIGPFLRLIFRPVVEGAENVPDEGPAILASNHLSYADWLFMPLTLPRRVTFVAKAEYFTSPGIKGWFQKKFFSGAGQVPIDRASGSAAEGALSSARRILDDGDLFGIYPEGTRSHDGRLYRGKTGVARLALETKVPVIPVAVVGTNVVAPPGKKFGRFTRPLVRFGKPLDFSRYEGMENDRYILRSVTDEIMYEIMRLSGQEYVDLYASKAKELAAKAKDEAKKAESEAAKEAPRPSGGRSAAEAGIAAAGEPPRPGPQEGVLIGPVLASYDDPAAQAVQDRLFRALAFLRVVLLANTVGLNLLRRDSFDHPTAALVVVLGLAVWTGVAIWAYSEPARRTPPLLVADLAVALLGLAHHPVAQGPRLQRDRGGLLGDGRDVRLGDPLALGRRSGGRGGSVRRRPAHPRQLHPEQLRQPVPADDRRPDHRLRLRLLAALGDGAGLGRADRGHRGRTRPAGARGARRRAPGPRPRPAPGQRAWRESWESWAGWRVSRSRGCGR